MPTKREINPLGTPFLPRGLFPEPHADDVRAIRHRALQLLKHRSPEELTAAASGVMTMLKAADDDLIDEMLERFEAEVSDRETGRFGAPQTLKLHMEVYDITGQPDFPAARWSEYFAVLALERFQLIVSRAQKHAEQNPEQIDRSAVVQATATQLERLAQSLPIIFDALESVVTAEQLAETEKFRGLVTKKHEAQTKEKRSLLASRAARGRHATLNQLKRDCIRHYLETNPPSLAEGARRFWRTVDEGRKAELCLRDPVRTLTQTLSQLRNGTLADHIRP